jgi:hypothetical protein
MATSPSRLLVVLCAMMAVAQMLVAEVGRADDTNAPPSASAPLPGQLPQIDVRARRMLVRNLDRYIAQVTHGSIAVDDQPMAQWKAPICPLVDGLPHDMGQALFDDFTDVIDSLGRLRGEQGCVPNFFILLMWQPDARLRAWWKQHPTAFSYERGERQQTDKFMSTTDAVRVWYNDTDKTIDGESAAAFASFSRDFFPGVPAFKLSSSNGSSLRTSFGVLPDLANVIVVVNLAKIDGYSLGSLAAYIAMVGLVEVNRDASFGQTPTILRLFSSPTNERPEGLSNWDRSFLKAIYSTDPAQRTQRVQVAEKMLTDLAPSAPTTK